MLYFISKTNDPYFNLAMEEYLLKNYEEDFFILYRNSPTLVIGKHQNTLAEINLEKAEEENVKVIRRLSGGGTVFHDLQNLNYCFIKRGEAGKLVNFKGYSQPIIDCLQKLGVNAKFEGKSDLTIEGMKFSGNASHVYKNKVMQHGTMLFSSDLRRLNQLLKVNPLKFKDRGVRSIRSRVTNIADFLSTPISIDQFSDHIIAQITQVFPEAKYFELSEYDKEKIQELISTKYGNWEWNFGYSPKYDFEKLTNYSNGAILEISMHIEKGYIKEVSINGNCINRESVLKLESIIKNSVHDKITILEILNSSKENYYFKNITNNQAIMAFF